MMRAKNRRLLDPQASDHRSRIFHRKMMEGNIRSAMRWLTDRDTSGLIHPYDIDDHHGVSVDHSLWDLHSPMEIPRVKDLLKFSMMPALGIVDITESTIATVASKLHGGAGIRGTPALSLQQWCMRYGTVSKHFRETLSELATWMSMEKPPWTSYRSLMSGKLIALGKGAGRGVHPIGIGDSIKHLLTKSVLELVKEVP